MKKYFTINNRRYEARDFDYNMICDLSEMGVNILDMSEIRKNPTNTIRAYVALCMDVEKDIAGDELQKHIVGGGSFDDVMNVMTSMIEESDFFQALGKTAEETTPAESKKAKKKE